MPDYKTLYYSLFGIMEDVLEQLDQANYGTAKQLLIHAQQAAEDAFLEADAEEAPAAPARSK